MRRAIVALASLTTVLAANPAHAEPVVLKPSSPWNVEFADEKCRLSRIFGQGDARHLLLIEQFGPETRFIMTAAGPSFERFKDREVTGLKFLSARDEIEIKPFLGTITDFGPAVVASSVPSAQKAETIPSPDSERIVTGLPHLDTDSAKEIEFVSLRQTKGGEVRLISGPLDDAFAVLNQCTADLVSVWGLNVEQQRAASKRPRWIDPEKVTKKILDSYPSSAVRQGEQGLLRMRLMVNEVGGVESCLIISATKTKKLDGPPCRIMQKAQFEPALDAEGKPMRSFFLTAITYTLN